MRELKCKQINEQRKIKKHDFNTNSCDCQWVVRLFDFESYGTIHAIERRWEAKHQQTQLTRFRCYNCVRCLDDCMIPILVFFLMLESGWIVANFALCCAYSFISSPLCDNQIKIKPVTEWNGVNNTWRSELVDLLPNHSTLFFFSVAAEETNPIWKSIAFCQHRLDVCVKLCSRIGSVVFKTKRHFYSQWFFDWFKYGTGVFLCELNDFLFWIGLAWLRASFVCVCVYCIQQFHTLFK